MQVGTGGGVLVDPIGGVDVDAELVLAQAGGDVGMGAGVYVRIDADRYRGHDAQGGGDPFQAYQLGLRLQIKAADADLQGAAHFVGALADAGEDDPGRVTSRRQHPLQLTDGDDVEARA